MCHFATAIISIIAAFTRRVFYTSCHFDMTNSFHFFLIVRFLYILQIWSSRHCRLFSVWQMEQSHISSFVYAFYVLGTENRRYLVRLHEKHCTAANRRNWSGWYALRSTDIYILFRFSSSLRRFFLIRYSLFVANKLPILVRLLHRFVTLSILPDAMENSRFYWYSTQSYHIRLLLKWKQFGMRPRNKEQK